MLKFLNIETVFLQNSKIEKNSEMYWTEGINI